MLLILALPLLALIFVSLWLLTLPAWKPAASCFGQPWLLQSVLRRLLAA